LSAGNEQKKHQYKKNIMEQLNDSALQIKCLLGDTENYRGGIDES
jgi:hypothetical protein